MSLLTRRSFLQRLGLAAAALAIKIPAFQRREPYVQVGDIASHIGPAPGGFIGGQTVVSIGAWDGVGYPVVTLNNAYGSHSRTETYYDIDLCDFNRELPPRFWADEENRHKYPNVHTYVRTKRYGENIHEAIRKLNYAGTKAEDFPIA